MNMPASTFPGHRFDFGDAVYIPATQTGGFVKGIYNEDGAWSYYIADQGPQRWKEDQLELACSHCLRPWNNLGGCPHCGFSYRS